MINLGGINPTRSRSNCKRNKEETSNALEISQINKHLAKAGLSNIGENMTKSPRMNANVKKSNTIQCRRSKFTKIMSIDLDKIGKSPIRSNSNEQQ
jgi:hypothetical protein